MTFEHKTALVIGGSRGVGRELSIGLSNAGARTVTVARGQDSLAKLGAAAPAIETVAVDAAKDGVADQLVADVSPDLLFLVGGHQPTMKPISDLTWDEFSAAWNVDTKIAFEFTKAALLRPMRRGGVIVSFSSGAALGGSRLSGGYAGAKKMQHWLSNYAASDRQDLGLKFYTIYPKQLIAGTSIGDSASAAYSAARSMSKEQFMNQWDKPLTAALVAGRVLELLADEAGATPGTYGITGTDIEAMV